MKVQHIIIEAVDDPFGTDAYDRELALEHVIDLVINLGRLCAAIDKKITDLTEWCGINGVQYVFPPTATTSFKHGNVIKVTAAKDNIDLGVVDDLTIMYNKVLKANRNKPNLLAIQESAFRRAVLPIRRSLTRRSSDPLTSRYGIVFENDPAIRNDVIVIDRMIRVLNTLIDHFNDVARSVVEPSVHK